MTTLPQFTFPLMTFFNFTFQDSSPLISYSDGQWVEGSPTNDTRASKYSDGSFKVTLTNDAVATLAFVGNSITIYGAKRPNHGNYSVVLDNKPAFIGDGNDDDTFRFPLWNAQNLTYGRHKAVLTNIPTSQGKFLDVDYVSIGREIGPRGYSGPIFNTTIDDESSFFIYNGSWSPNFSSTAFSSSLHGTTEEGASVSISFQGSSVELYGLYVNAPFQAQVDDQPASNLAGPNVDLNTQQEHPQTLLYYVDGLDENKTHVVTLTNTVANSGRPFYIDYAVVRSSQEPTVIYTPAPAQTSSVSTVRPSSTPNSRSFPVGAVVGETVGGFGGLIILAFVGLIFFRRSRYLKYSNKSTGITTFNKTPPVSEIHSFVSTSARNSGVSSSSAFSYSTETGSESYRLEGSDAKSSEPSI